MGARSGNGTGFGSEFGNLPKGGYKEAPFEGAAKISDLKDGDVIVTPDGVRLKVSILKESKTQVVIGT